MPEETKPVVTKTAPAPTQATAPPATQVAPAPTTVSQADAEIAAVALDALKQKATQLGMTFHPSIGEETLRGKIKEFQAAQEAAKTPEPKLETSGIVAAPDSEVKNAKLEALALVRVNVTSMNPQKKDYQAETITTGNSLTGTVRRVVPFNRDTHVPTIILNVMREKTFQVWTERTINGKKSKVSSKTPAYAINVLPPLTPEEMQALAVRQAASKGTAAA